ncbi:MAG: TOBE domain-containing protein, partial [Lachnospiraceae bacterium]|nr:TOBE domain-containing protein [Lachnospiraceae bacterium]
LKATIRVYELMGAEVFLYFDCAEQNITARVAPSTEARPGSEVNFKINMDHIHAFDVDTEEALF